MLGYTGKFLEVDLSNGNSKNVTIDKEWLKDYVGGRALAAKILCNRLIHKWQEVDPLGPDNILLFYPTIYRILSRRKNLCFRQVSSK